MRPRSARNVLTMRSSSEWNETTTSRPPGLSMRSAAASAATSSASSSLTKMRSAWNVRVAGWISPGLRAHDARRRCRPARRVVAIGAARRAPDDGARDGARMRSSPSVEDDVGEIALGRRARRRRRRSGRRRPCACRAGRRAGTRSRARPGRAASTTRRDRARRRRPRRGRDLRATSSSSEKRSSTSVSRPPAASTRSAPRAIALRSRSMPMTLAVRGREDRARIAAGAEGAVDIDAAVARR